MICTNCNTDKSETLFYKRSDGRDALRSHCKQCMRAKDKKWAQDNPETYRAANAASTRSWYSRNRDKACEMSRVAQRRMASENPVEYMVRSARTRAKAIGIPFDITSDDVHMPEFCPVLGIRLDNSRRSPSSRAENLPTLDRVNPSLGYVRGNVAVVSHRANRIKSDASLAEVELIAAYIRRMTGGHEAERVIHVDEVA